MPNRIGNPNFKNKFYHGKTKVMRFPECFEEILTYVAYKLDSQLMSEIDLERLIENYIKTALDGIKGINKPENKQEINCYRIDLDSLLKSMDDSQKLSLLKKLLKE